MRRAALLLAIRRWLTDNHARSCRVLSAANTAAAEAEEAAGAAGAAGAADAEPAQSGGIEAEGTGEGSGGAAAERGGGGAAAEGAAAKAGHCAARRGLRQEQRVQVRGGRPGLRSRLP